MAAALVSPSSAVASDPYARYLASSSACPSSDATGLTPAESARALSCLVAHARRLRGLSTLRTSQELSRAAALKLADDVRCGRILSHDPCGFGWRAVFRRAGYLPAHRVRLGENLGYAQGSFATPRSVLDMWLNSPPHRRNLFDPRFRDGGVAVLSVDGGVLYAGAFGTRSG